MSASDSGCYSGWIENGNVQTTSCQPYNSRVYCRYYCDDGYTKTASTAYCAGNEKWLSEADPSGKLCVKDEEKQGCYSSRFLENGYVTTLPCSTGCSYDCFRGFKKVSSTVYCADDGQWIPTGSQPWDNQVPCVYNGDLKRTTTTTTTTDNVVPNFTQTTAKYRGYYDDPSMRMDVSPVVFVGAVVGGIALLVVIAFAVFFRAHRKSALNARARRFLSEQEHISPYQIPVVDDNYRSFPNANDYDDSEFRDIARRIVARANQGAGTPDENSNKLSTNSHIPPPYDAVTSPFNGHEMRGSVPHEPPGYSLQQINGVSNEGSTQRSSQLRLETYSLEQGNQNLASLRSVPSAVHNNTISSPYTECEEPPPYETQLMDEPIQPSAIEPPPPYSIC